MRLDMKRCAWCNLNNPLYVKYHDEEWGRLCLDDHHLFEMLILESFQAGLSWECVLKKREGFRKAFDGFDAEAVAQYGQEKLDSLTTDKSIIRNRKKIQAATNNAKVFLRLKEEYSSFAGYLGQFWNGEVIYDPVSTTSPLAHMISDDLRRRGMSFMGPTVVHSFLQAVGIVYAHEEGCFMYKAKN